MNLEGFKNKLNVKNKGGQKFIFDLIRSKYVVLTPEELIRQLVIQFLIEEKNYPKNKISVEKEIVVNGMRRRFDVLIYDNDFNPWLIIECKSYKVPITQSTFDQIVQYNLSVKAKYLLLTNGTSFFCCLIDQEKKTYEYLSEIPFYE